VARLTRDVILSTLAMLLFMAGCRDIAGYAAAPSGGLDIAGDHLVAPPDGSADGRVDLLIADMLAPDLLPPCGRAPGPGLVARYTFDDMTAQDTFEAQPNTLPPAKGYEADFEQVPNGPSCGKALQLNAPLEGGAKTYAAIPHHAAWDLTEGALSLRVHPTRDDSVTEGLISRDAFSTEAPGHLTVVRSAKGRLIARLQWKTGLSAFACSEVGAMPRDTWSHIGLNFGGSNKKLELWLNGVQVTSTDTHSTDWLSAGIDCTQNDQQPGGIAGNKNPWVLGAAANLSGDDTATPVTDPFQGRIDEFRIYDRRQNFGN
jgi:hypothetical protein